jgi:hypothetical protein
VRGSRVDGGLDADAAIHLTRTTRPKAIDRGHQEAFVKMWGERRQRLTA